MVDVIATAARVLQRFDGLEEPGVLPKAAE
jgi:hypothetical protein